MDEKDFEGNKMNMSKEDAERWLKYVEAIDRLKKNQDFQLLFDIYTRSEILRASYLLSDDVVNNSVNKNQIKENLTEKIKASAAFHNYIKIDIENMRQAATNTLTAYREEEAHQG